MMTILLVIILSIMTACIQWRPIHATHDCRRLAHHPNRLGPGDVTTTCPPDVSAVKLEPLEGRTISAHEVDAKLPSVDSPMRIVLIGSKLNASVLACSIIISTI